MGNKLAKRNKAPPVRVELLLAFTRALIRDLPSRDLLKLALLAAARETGASEGETSAMWSAIQGESSQSVYPKGFF